MPDSDMQPRPIADTDSPPRPSARCSNFSVCAMVLGSFPFADRRYSRERSVNQILEECPMPSEARVALITGCGKPVGIGNSTARALAAAGVAVVVSDVAPPGVANEHNVQGDMDANWGGVDSLVEAIVKDGGTASA